MQGHTVDAQVELMQHALSTTLGRSGRGRLEPFRGQQGGHVFERCRIGLVVDSSGDC